MAGQIAKQQAGAAEDSSSLRGSPRTPATTAETSEQELNINELISQYAGPKPVADTEMKDDNASLPTLPHSQRPSSLPEPTAKSQGSSLGSPTKVTKPSNGKMIGNGLHTKNLGSRHASSGSMSEGEIFEDGAAKNAMPPTEPKEAITTVKAINKEEPATHKPRDEQPLKTTQSRVLRDTSPSRRALPNNSKSQAPRRLEDRRDETDPRHDRRPHPSDYTNERRPYPTESERTPYQRRDIRDTSEDHHRSDSKSEKREDMTRPSREARQPTLADLLPHDEDLREWLEITGYHNGTYRDKILNRRRAIAALDAQRNALLAEMEAEERGGVQAIGGLPTPSSAMLPPPIPNKAGDRAEPSLKPTTTASETQRDRVVSNKRPYSDGQDHRDESSAKVARTNDRGPRIKQQEDADYGRPRSSDYDSSRRRSFDDRRDDRDSSRHEGRGRGRGSSRERDISPGRMAYENRPPARTRSYDVGDDFHVRERDDWEERERDRSDRRPFEVRGGYRGRAFDPNYRGRGGRGGRGRGDFQSHMEQRAEPGSFGARIANGKPFRRDYDRGGKGGQ
jgi:hypothetical protein